MSQSDPVRLRIAASQADNDSETDNGYDTRGQPSRLAQTFEVDTYPVDADAFYAMKAVILTGDEVEGGPGTLTISDEVFYAYNLGGSVPAAGTYLIVTYVEHRWVFWYDAT